MDPSSSKDNYDADYKDTAELNTDFTKNRSTEVYHYEAPNLTSMLYEYTNKEQEYINRCFRTGNYTTLREMPDNFVGCTLFKNDGSSRFSKGQPLFGSGMGQKNLDLKQRSALDKDSKSDPNDKFSNMTDDYDAFLKSLKEEKRDAKEKQMKLHKEDFNQYKAHPKYKGKYEDPFRTDTDSKEKYHFPFLNESDPYEAAKDEVYRNKWLEDSKNLYGEFKPSYKETSLNIPGRTLFMEILEEVKKVLLADWNDVNFVIGTNPQEMIEIKFECNTEDTEKGLKIYMNNFISAHTVMRKYGLRRVTHFWGYKEDYYIYYMVAPPWVKLPVNDVVNYWKISQVHTQETETSEPSFSSDEEELSAKKKIRYRIKNTAKEKKPLLYSRTVDM